MHNVTVKDILGTEVKINSWIAISFKEGNNAVLRIGKVVGFGRRNSIYSSNDTFAVEWYISSGIMLPAKATSIDSDTTRCVIIPSPLGIDKAPGNE